LIEGRKTCLTGRGQKEQSEKKEGYQRSPLQGQLLQEKAEREAVVEAEENRKR